MYLNAEFTATKAVADAVRALRAMGLSSDQIELFSAKPVDLEPGVLDRPSRMSLFAVLGALLGGGLTTAFIFYTQLDYPLVTGGMPLTSGWATGVVTFEFTMGGAVVGTVLTFLWEGGLVRFWKRVPTSPLRANLIGVRLDCPDQLAGRAGDLLRDSGAVSVEKMAESS